MIEHELGTVVLIGELRHNQARLSKQPLDNGRRSDAICTQLAHPRKPMNDVWPCYLLVRHGQH